MSKRPLSSLSLPFPTLSALTRGGYETVEDISTLTPETLSKDLNIPLSSSQAIFSASQGPNSRTVPMTQSAASLAGNSSRLLSTLCGPLDRLLGGGLKQGYILELSGPPGCHKEALAINIVTSYVNANVHSSQNVLFVDMQNMTTPATLDRALPASSPAPSDYGKRVEYLRLHSLTELMVFIRNLPSYVQSHTKTSLLVLNSLSFPFQSAVTLNKSNRTALLDRLKQVLARVCASARLTVVITSQLATKLLKADGSAGNFDTGTKAILVPHLGPAYLPSGRAYRVIVVPQSRTSGVLRLLSSPAHLQEKKPPGEEPYQLVST
ncbi:uncharacterized protein LAESUDRAFT_664388 [Laetiporus sulphureus 93-53]|uniref:DNA repair protein RAD51 homolog 3 n=1 Tax=Laetiporus sulphureus 93-53 TaxID=1314785 RepID=A0A165BKC7_9APHY|nr:uncharacterized protein LAESUDRAFT_664388 [Laetiporus sulphureus 93-53]KZT01214.1 hypothetical protein LAESUDRAFT_664388 [Laetiporus sulphureus 93-53]